MAGNESYSRAVLDSNHLKTRVVSFDNGFDVLDAAKAVNATHVCVPLEFDVLGSSVREEGFALLLILWDYHDDVHFSLQYDKALALSEQLGAVGIALAQPRIHTKQALNGYARYRGVRRVVEEGSWSRDLKHYLFGGFNPAEPVIYRNMFSSFINATIAGYISGIMLRSILYGQVFSPEFGIYDRVIDEMEEYRVSPDAAMGDYPVSDSQFGLWNRNMDHFRGFFSGVGGSGLVEYIIGEEQYENGALQGMRESVSDANFGPCSGSVFSDGPL